MLFRDPITSVQNPRIKNFIHLQKAKERKEQNVFVLEGSKEYAQAIRHNYQFASIFVCPDLISEVHFKALSAGINHDAEVYPVSKDVFDKIAYREGSGGIIALARPKTHSLQDLKLKPNPLLLILEAVEKPGNLGAILRTADAAGVIKPDYPWLNRAIIVAILGGYASVILVMLMGQSRVFFSMSKDGLIPRIFSAVNPKSQTPAKSNLLFMLFVSLFAAFVPARVVGEMTSIGTLFAFILVCIGVWVMRKKMPELPRAFKTPFVPLVPILGIFVCLFMMVFLPMDTWIRLLVWMLIGMDIYLVYGAKHSHLGNGTDNRKGMRIARYTSLALCLLLIVVGFLHQYTVGFDTDRTLLYVALAFAVVHLGVFGRKLGRVEPEA